MQVFKSKMIYKLLNIQTYKYQNKPIPIVFYILLFMLYHLSFILFAIFTYKFKFTYSYIINFVKFLDHHNSIQIRCYFQKPICCRNTSRESMWFISEPLWMNIGLQIKTKTSNNKISWVYTDDNILSGLEEKRFKIGIVGMNTDLHWYNLRGSIIRLIGACFQYRHPYCGILQIATFAQFSQC